MNILRFIVGALGAGGAVTFSCAVAAEKPASGKLAGDAPVIKNSIGLEFVRIEPGEFWMGSPAEEPGRGVNELRHRVTITKPYLLSTCEVQRGVFASFLRETGFRTDAEKEGWGSTAHIVGMGAVSGLSWRNPGFEQTDEHPVVCVSWSDALNFCDWLSHKEKKRYRLPTEAEWEYACRANEQSMFAWGDEPDHGAGWANFADVTAKEELPKLTDVFNWSDGYVYTAPAASFKPNTWGLYDMSGNVCEWCSDRYTPFTAEPQRDPTGPGPDHDRGERMIRGGSWDLGGKLSRIANRAWAQPQSRFNFVGFRVVLEIEHRNGSDH